MAEMIHALSEVAFGKEASSTPGTIVVADTGLVVDDGIAVYEEVIQRDVLSAPRGVLAEVEDVITRKGSGLSAPQDLTYEEFPIVLQAGLKDTTGVLGTTGDYTYTVLPSLVTPDALASFSFEVFGTDGTTRHFLRKFGYGQVSEFSVSGSFGEAAKLNATWFGRAGQTLASTDAASPAVLTREIVITDLFKLYIDPNWAALGSTQKSGLLRSFTFRVNTGVMPDYTLDGRTDLDLTKTRRGMITGDVEMVAEFNADAATEVTAWRDGTLRFIRLEALGSTIAATATQRKVSLSAAVKYIEAPTISEADGIVTVTLRGRFRYDPTSGNVVQAVVANGVAAY